MNRAIAFSIALAPLACGAPRPSAAIAIPIATPPALATLVRTRNETHECGTVRLVRSEVLEGVDANGKIVWTLALEGLEVMLSLPDSGGAFALVRESDASLTLRIGADGKVVWGHRWPQPQSTMEGPSRRIDGPDPSAALSIAERDGWLFVAFEERNVSGFAEGLDVWKFADKDGAVAGRRRVAFGDSTNFAMGGHGAIFAVDEHSGRLDVVDLDGALVFTGSVQTPSVAPAVGAPVGFPSLVHTEANLDVLDGGDRLSSYDWRGLPVWSYGTAAPTVAVHAPPFGGVVFVDEACRLTALDDAGHFAWSQALTDDPAVRCTDDLPPRFASDEHAIVVLLVNDRKTPAIAASFSATGVPLFRVSAEDGLALIPVVEGDRARLCAKDVNIALPPLAPQGITALHADAMNVEAQITQELDAAVDALTVLGPGDAAAIAGGHLWRSDKGRLHDTGAIRATLPIPKVDRPITITQFAPIELSGGTDGSLWVAGGREATFKGGVELAGDLASVLRSQGGAFVDVTALDGVFVNAFGASSTSETRVLAGDGEAIVCQLEWCRRVTSKRTTEIQMPSDWRTADLAWIGGSAWVLGPSVARIEGDTLVTTDVKVTLPDVRAAHPPKITGSGPDDIWIVDTELRHYDGKSVVTHHAPLSAPRDVWSAAPNDVWLVGDDGIAHYDGKTWARVLGAGMPVLTRVVGRGTGVWLAGPSGAFHVTQHGPHRVVPRVTPGNAAGEVTQEIAPASISNPGFAAVTLRPTGRAPVVDVAELAANGSVLWLRDSIGVTSFDGHTPTTLVAREALGGFGCRQCLAPLTRLEGVVIGRDAAFSFVAGKSVRIEPRLDAMLAVDLARAKDGTMHPRIAAGTRALEEPSALWLDEGAYGYEIPRGCYVALDANGDETWLAGGLQCLRDTALAPWPAGEGILVRRTRTEVRWIRAPEGPLLGVHAVGPAEAWAVGVGGAIVHVKGDEVTRYRLATHARLHTVTSHGGTTWIGGDDRTLLRTDGKTFERVDLLPLPARSVVLSLAFRDDELWLGSPDGVLRRMP